MIHRFALVTTLLLVQSLQAASESDDPIDLKVEDYSETVCYVNCREYGYSWDMPQEFITHTSTRVLIQAKTDGVVIQDVELNRGNCPSVGDKLPQQLQFGEHVRLIVQQSDTVLAKGCNIIEIVVKTDQGEIVFSD